MKRFSETDKWRDPWFQALPHGSKLVFLYLCDTCNNAGFYEENVREACFHLGIDEKQYQGALKGLTRGIKGALGWLWIRRFLRHQKNEPLNPENPAHRQIVRLIAEQVGRFDEFPEFQQFIAPYKGLLSPTGKGTGKGTLRKRAEKPQSEFANRLSGIFKRNGSTPWSEKEISAFGRLQFDESEVSMLERYYGRERNKKDSICRRDLQTLLNNYAGEVDRARGFCNRQEAKSDRKTEYRPPELRAMHDPTEEEMESQRKIVREASAQLKAELNR